MAIGSAPEIGLKYNVGLDGWLDGAAAAWRAEVGDNLLGGYAALYYPSQERKDRINQEWETTERKDDI